MHNLLPLVFLLACPVGMAFMMVFMGKGMSGSNKRETRRDEPSLLELKNEQARLHAQIERLEAARLGPSPSRAAPREPDLSEDRL